MSDHFNPASKDRPVYRKKRVAIGGAVVIALLAVACIGLFGGAFQNNLPRAKDELTDEILAMAQSVTEEETLRVLLNLNTELEIYVADDIEISETLSVVGTKKLSGTGAISASATFKPFTPVLDITKKSSLEIAGVILDGNSLADGINVERNAMLTAYSNEILYAGRYGISTAGQVFLTDTNIHHIGSAAVDVREEGEVWINGGSYSYGAKRVLNVRAGGILHVNGEADIQYSDRALVYNEGELIIQDGTFAHAGMQCIQNFGKLFMEYGGDKNDGYIEVSDAATVGIYTTSNSSFLTKVTRVHVNGTGLNSLAATNTTGRLEVHDCWFENAGGNAMTLRGKVYVENVKIHQAGESGIFVREKADATLENIQIDTTVQYGIHCSEECSAEIINARVDNAKNNGIYVNRSTVSLRDVAVNNSSANGISVNLSTANLENVTIDKVGGRGLSTNGAVVTGKGVTIKNTKTIGIIADENTRLSEPSRIELSNVQLEQVGGNNIKVAHNSSLWITGGTLRSAKRTSVYVDSGDILLKDVTVWGSTDEDCNCVQVQKDGRLIVDGATEIHGAPKRAVAVAGGHFTMNSGRISNVTAIESGAGVHVASGGTFIMNGGEITKNHSAKNGGGVNISKDSTFIMNGGKIYGNDAVMGGGVRCDGFAKFTFNGGEIYGNSARESVAGGVYVGGTMVMTGGSIYQNTANASGGGVYLETYVSGESRSVGTILMSGGIIYENTAIKNGGGIHLGKGASAKLTGGAVQSNKAAGNGDGIYDNGTLTVGQAFLLKDNKIRMANRDIILSVTGTELTGHSAENPMQISPASDAKEGDTLVSCESIDAATSVLQYVSASGGYQLLLSADKMVLAIKQADMDMTDADTVTVSTFVQLKTAVEDTQTKRYVVVQSDIAVEDTIHIPGGTTVCIKDDGSARTLTRADGNNKTFFNNPAGSGLYLEGTQNGYMRLDGQVSGITDETNIQPIVKNAGSISVKGVDFYNNGTENTSGLIGAFIKQSRGDAMLVNAVFSGARASGGGALHAQSGTITAQDCSFMNNKTTAGGGMARLESGTELILERCVVCNNVAGSVAGAVNVDGGRMSATDCDFEGNSATGQGGAFRITNGGTLSLISTEPGAHAVSGSMSGQQGGAILVNKGTLLVDGYAFTDNTAAEQAGAIYFATGTTSSLYHTSFIGNSTLNSSAGALMLQTGSKVTVMNSAFFNNSAPTSSGGTIRLDAAARLDMISCQVTASTAKTNGGAVNNNGGSLYLSGSVFSENTASGDGGAIYMANAAEITAVNGCRFEKNTSIYGGAIYVVSGSLSATDSYFAQNTAENGGAILAQDATDIVSSTFEENGAKYRGGVIYITGSPQVSVQESTMKGNYTSVAQKDGSANQGGGAICQNNGTVTVSNTAFESNNSAGYGGAIVAFNGTMLVNGCSFTTNTSPVGGDAIAQVAGSSEMVLCGSKFSNQTQAICIASGNSSVTDTEFTVGTQLKLMKNGAVTFAGEVKDIVAVIASPAAEKAAISISKDGLHTDSRIVIQPDACEAGKQVVTSEDASVLQTSVAEGLLSLPADVAEKWALQEDGTINSNTTAVQIGEKYYGSLEQALATVTDHTPTTIILHEDVELSTRVELTDRNITLCGKGITIRKSDDFSGSNLFKIAVGSSLTVEGTEQAKDAIIVDGENGSYPALFYNQGELTLKNVSVINGAGSNNGNGGGINADNGVLICQNCLFKNCVAYNGGAVFVSQNADVTMTDVCFDENRTMGNCGGAIYCQGKLTITDSKFVGNAAYKNGVLHNGGAIYIPGAKAQVTISNTEFANNQGKDGGAIRITKGVLHLVSCNFTQNIASNVGGAIGSSDTAEVTITSTAGTVTSFAENQSSNVGGALYMSAGTVLFEQETVFDGNVAANSGGALYIAGGNVTNSGSVTYRKDSDTVVGTVLGNAFIDGRPKSYDIQLPSMPILSE